MVNLSEVLTQKIKEQIGVLVYQVIQLNLEKELLEAEIQVLKQQEKSEHG